MGKVWSQLNRSLKNFNIDNRAIRAAQRHTPSPRYPTEAKMIAQLQADHPEMFDADKISRKDDRLDANLRQIHVHSAVKSDSQPSVRPLPQKNWRADGQMDFTYGFIDVPADKIPPGKTSFRQAVEIFQFFQADPSKDNFATIVKSTQLTEAQLKRALRFFALYKVTADPQMIGNNKLELLKGFNFTRVLNPPIDEVINYIADKQDSMEQSHKNDVEREKREGRKNFAKPDKKAD